MSPAACQASGKDWATSVVRDGNGGVAPADGLLDHLLGVGEGVHVAHPGVEVELHPLLRGGVLLHFLLRRGDGHRLQHHVAVEAVHVQPALDLDVHPLFNAVHQGLALLAWKKLVHPDGAGVVGHVKGHHPGPSLFQLPVVDGEDVPLHHHHAHVQLQLPMGVGALEMALPKMALPWGFFSALTEGAARLTL